MSGYVKPRRVGGRRVRRYVSETRDEWRWTAHAEESMANCPYYLGVGTCVSGCWDEPSCITDQPVGGWPTRAPVLW